MVCLDAASLCEEDCTSRTKIDNYIEMSPDLSRATTLLDLTFCLPLIEHSTVYTLRGSTGFSGATGDSNWDSHVGLGIVSSLLRIAVYFDWTSVDREQPRGCSSGRARMYSVSVTMSLFLMWLATSWDFMSISLSYRAPYSKNCRATQVTIRRHEDIIQATVRTTSQWLPVLSPE